MYLDVRWREEHLQKLLLSTHYIAGASDIRLQERMHVIFIAEGGRLKTAMEDLPSLQTIHLTSLHVKSLPGLLSPTLAINTELKARVHMQATCVGLL